MGLKPIALADVQQAPPPDRARTEARTPSLRDPNAPVDASAVEAVGQRLHDLVTAGRTSLAAFGSWLGANGRDAVESFRADPLPLSILGLTMGGLVGILGVLGYEIVDAHRPPDLDHVPPAHVLALDSIPGPGVELADGRVVFVDRERAWVLDRERGEISSLGWLETGFKSVLEYKGQVVALRGDGDIALWIPTHTWAELGNNAKDLAVVGDDLIALTREGQIWRYKGAPGAEHLNISTQTTIIGNSTIVTVNVGPGDRDVAFTDTGIHGVARIERDGQTVTVRFEDGRSADLGSLLDSPLAP